MTAAHILTANFLDILFEGRNKDYGAYALRKSYNRRLMISLTGTLLVLSLMSFLVTRSGVTIRADAPLNDSVTLVSLPPQLPREPIAIPPPPPPPQAPKASQTRFAIPVIVPDHTAPADFPPVEKLEYVRIGLSDKDGLHDIATLPVASAAGRGIIALPEPAPQDENEVFKKVEIESEFPGGPAAWQRFLNKTLNYPADAIDNEIEGAVMVQFIVDQAGNVTEAKAISGPEELQREAVRVIRKSGRWEPAIQNGRKVKSYKLQGIVFRLGR